MCLPLDLIENQWSDCCSPKCFLDKGNITFHKMTTAIWSREDLASLQQKGFFAEFVKTFSGDRHFVGLTPLTVTQAKEILRQEKLATYGERYLEDKVA